MDQPNRRSGDLARRMRAAIGGAAPPPESLAAEADSPATAARSTWIRVHARATAAAARLLRGGGPPALAATVVDAELPIPVPDALARLDELLVGDGSLAERLDRHRRRTRVDPDQLSPVAARLIALLAERAREDLDLAADESFEVRIAPGGSVPGGHRVDTRDRVTSLILDAGHSWTVVELVELVCREGYPGRHLARLCRVAMPAWEPSPQTSVLRGLELVGREVLLGDYELAAELERIGRRVGARWPAAHQLELRSALERLVPEMATLLVRGVADGVRATPIMPDAMYPTVAEGRPGPLRGAAWLARACGPPLVREWLAVVGQTQGLRRLIHEPLVPEQLRSEVAGAP